MLGILADSFMTATRTGTTPVRDLHRRGKPAKRWLPLGHWWVDPVRDIDVTKL